MNEMMSNIGYFNMHMMLEDCLWNAQKSAANSGVPGIASGFFPLDELMCGFEAGKMYVIGGRPCIGREEFMLSMIRDITLESKLPVLLFSTNHQKKDYVERLVSIHCDIPTSHLHRGRIDSQMKSRLDMKIGTLADAPLFIHDSLDLPLNELVETARNCISKEGTKIIFIDCLQMIDFAKGEEASSERVAKVMYSLKQLAYSSNLPIVVGSMLNRGVEYREVFEGKRPQLVDLANSSYIEGLADVIMMVHRPEYYHIYQDEHGRDLHGLMEIIVRKNALKPLGSIFLDYKQETGIITSKSASKPVSLKNFKTDNEAIRKLIKAFNLEEVFA